MKEEPEVVELSKRELELLKLISEGLTNAEIAEKLFTSKRTIDSHRQRINEKSQAKNTTAVVKYVNLDILFNIEKELLVNYMSYFLHCLFKN